jgi:hypothetical protein
MDSKVIFKLQALTKREISEIKEVPLWRQTVQWSLIVTETKMTCNLLKRIRISKME